MNNQTNKIIVELIKNMKERTDLDIDKTFVLINRIIIGILIIIIGYMQYNLMMIGTGKLREIFVLIAPLLILILSLIVIKSVFGFKMFNTFLAIAILFYLGLGLLFENNLFVILGVISIGLFIYNVINSKLYGLKKYEITLIKVK